MYKMLLRCRVHLAIHLEGGGLVVLYELGPGGLLHQPPNGGEYPVTGLDLENVCIRYINHFFFLKRDAENNMLNT